MPKCIFLYLCLPGGAEAPEREGLWGKEREQQTKKRCWGES